MVPSRYPTLLVYLACVQVFEQVAFLPLVIAHIERVTSQILPLPVEVLHHWKGVIVRALGHSICILTLLDASSEAALVLYVSW